MKWVRGLGLAAAIGAAAAFVQAQPSAAQSYNWTGLYFGGHVGGAWSSSTAQDALAPFGGYFTTGLGDTFKFDSSGVAGGGQLGYQLQFGRWVLGAEVAGTWADLHDRHTSPFFPTDRVEMRINPILTATARLGYAWDRWLAYVKGGYAGTDLEMRALDTVAGVSLNYNDHWVSGYTVGAGIEYALYDGVRIGLDYSYIDLQTERLIAGTTLGTPERFDTTGDIHTVSARINFQLGRPEPRYEPLK
ncbi:MAG: outer membrane beta-barrel protein [Hyphomicrobiaceae bacterium]